MNSILIISAVFPPEPVVSARLSADIAEKLSQENNVEVICPKPSRPYGYKYPNNEQPNIKYKVSHLNSFVCAKSKLFGRLRESYSFGIHCRNFINKNQFNLIYVNAWPIFAQFLIIKIAKEKKIPCIIHIQDIYPESLLEKRLKIFESFVYHILLPIDRYILKNASHILAISNRMINFLSTSRKIPLEKFTLVRNWQDDTAYDYNSKLKHEKSDKTFRFMYVGSIVPSANVENIIYAFDKAKLPNTELVIAGDGSEKEKCIKITDDLKNRNITFQSIDPKEVPRLQSSADVLLLPLKKGIAKTATPSKLTSYLLSSKLVIACVETNTDIAEIITNSKCGFIVKPEDAIQLSEAMQKVIGLGSAKIIEMGELGREYALLHFSRETNLKRVIKIIDSANKC